MNIIPELDKGQMYHWSIIEYLDLPPFATTFKHKDKQMVEYLEIVASYDIETSSFRDEGRATALTYAHGLNIEGYCFMAREWDELKSMFDILKEMFNLGPNRRLVIYVHNLSYEFQFLKGQMRFTENFVNGNERRILYALASHYGIEFRCSYMLANAPLATVADNLTQHNIKKLDGDVFDYKKIRTPETPLTDEEVEYLLHDILIVEYYIRETLELQKRPSITRVPLTSTGFVRQYTRQNTVANDRSDSKETKKKKQLYRELITTLTMEVDEYEALRRVFAGGYTHANAFSSGKVMKKIKAYDFTSSYPARMVAYKYPMGKGELYDCTDKRDFMRQISEYCCLFYIRLKGVSSIAVDDYISFSKVTTSENAVVNNGRINSATSIEMWVTEVDFAIISQAYEIDDYNIGKMWRYKKGYLPTELIEAVLKLYSDKTRYKGVADQIVNYNMAKAMLNSIFGMCVQDVVKEDFVWDGVDASIKQELGLEDITVKIEKYNKSKNRFLFYPWGVWITAYGRYDLFTDIVLAEEDYHYGDTDSIYVNDTEKMERLVEKSNIRIKKLLDDAIVHHGIDPDLISPMDPQGKRHTIGLWSVDGEYTRFKTLGAKRYMVEKWVYPNKKKGETFEPYLKVDITVSGVNKKKAVPYLMETYGDDVFEAFSEDLLIPAKYTGKPKPIYFDKCDERREGKVVDYLGGEYHYYEATGLCLEESSYTMGISPEYNEFLKRLYNKAHIV